MVEKQFFNGMTMNDIGKRAHVIKHSHGRCVVGAFNKILHEGYFWNGHRALIYFILHKSILLHFLHHGTNFYEKYIESSDRKICIDYYGSIIFPKKKVRNIQNEKYYVAYATRNFVLEREYIKDTRIRRVYSGRKQKATGFVYLQGSPYRDSEGSSQLISCLNYAIINVAPIIGEN